MHKTGTKKFKLQHPKTYLVILLLYLVLPFALYFGLVHGIAWMSISSGILLGLGVLTLLILK